MSDGKILIYENDVTAAKNIRIAKEKETEILIEKDTEKTFNEIIDFLPHRIAYEKVINKINKCEISAAEHVFIGWYNYDILCDKLSNYSEYISVNRDPNKKKIKFTISEILYDPKLLTLIRDQLFNVKIMNKINEFLGYNCIKLTNASYLHSKFVNFLKIRIPQAIDENILTFKIDPYSVNLIGDNQHIYDADHLVKLLNKNNKNITVKWLPNNIYEITVNPNIEINSSHK